MSEPRKRLWNLIHGARRQLDDAATELHILSEDDSDEVVTDLRRLRDYVETLEPRVQAIERNFNDRNHSA